MSRRTSTLALVLTLTALVLSLVTVAPVSAKEGMEARLDAPLSIASPGGSTMHVGWTVFVTSEGKEVPVYGSPVFIRLLPRGEGEPSIEFGTERPDGSGHYFADIVVPASGIGMVEVGMRGSQCVSGVCSTSDMVFRVLGDTLAVAGTPGAVVGVLPAAAASPVAPAAAAPGVVAPAASAKAPASTTAATTAAANAPTPTVALVGGLVLVAALVVVAILAVRRRRQPSGMAASRS